MAKWTIYHNPKCSKSREALSLLQEKGIEPEIREYLKNPPSEQELQDLLGRLKEPSRLVRTKEDIYKQLKFDIEDHKEIVRHLSRHPILIERPVVIKDKQAIVARPVEMLDELF